MPGLFGGFGINFYFFWVFENGENKPSNLTSTFSHTNRTRNRIDFHSFIPERKKERKEENGRNYTIGLLTYFLASPFSPGQRPVYQLVKLIRLFSINIYTYLY